jgi:hypothetical protein
VASETPGLIEYYAHLVGRNDLASLSLSDHEAMRQFTAGDFVIIARGRRYFSNEELTGSLQQTSAPTINLSLGKVPSVTIYLLDEASARSFTEAAAR